MRNKTASKQYFKDMLSKKVLTIGDLEELLLLLLPYKKLKSKVVSIRIEKNKYGKNHFVYLCENGDEDSFSYIKAVDFAYGKTEKPIDKFRSSLRTYLQPEMRKFKREWIKRDPHSAISGKHVDMHNSHVDHHGGFEFRDIFSFFCRHENVDFSAIPYDETIDGCICTNHELLATFQVYHDALCELRVITVDENLTKSKINTH